MTIHSAPLCMTIALSPSVSNIGQPFAVSGGEHDILFSSVIQTKIPFSISSQSPRPVRCRPPPGMKPFGKWRHGALSADFDKGNSISCVYHRQQNAQEYDRKCGIPKDDFGAKFKLLIFFPHNISEPSNRVNQLGGKAFIDLVAQITVRRHDMES
jgi:hypothetical protein